MSGSKRKTSTMQQESDEKEHRRGLESALALQTPRDKFLKQKNAVPIITGLLLNAIIKQPIHP